MSKASWYEKLAPAERDELENARKIKDAARDDYNVIYRRLKARCDARIRRMDKANGSKGASE